MNHSKPLIRRYCRQLRSLLPCNWWEKRKLISGLRQQMNAYAAERPNLTEDDLHTHFGTPEEVAVSCLENTDSTLLLSRILGRQYFAKAVTTCVMIALLVWVSLMGYILYDYLTPDGYFEIIVIETGWRP